MMKSCLFNNVCGIRKSKQILCASLIGVVLSMLAPTYGQHKPEGREHCLTSKGASWCEAGVEHLIAHIGWAAQHQDFSGRYTISQTSGMLALHATHVFIDEQEYELLTTLTGEKHFIFKQDDSQYAIDPQTKKIVFEQQSLAEFFPSWGRPGYGNADQHYQVSFLGTERFLDRRADMLYVTATDDLRFNYRVWLDQETGILLRLEVEEEEGVALQRFLFTDIDLMPATQAEKERLYHYLERIADENYRIKEWPFAYVSAQEHGWVFSSLPDGFEAVTCVLRPVYDEKKNLLQCVFSDGVASVSIFIEAQEAQDDLQTSVLPRNGATHGIVYPLEKWKITLVGEVPEKTLQAFALALQRVPGQYE